MSIFRFTPAVGQCGWGWPFMGLGGGMFFGFAILIVFGVGLYYAFLPRRRMRREDDALDIARRRLARGEITVEEFEDIKKRLV